MIIYFFYRPLTLIELRSINLFVILGYKSVILGYVRMNTVCTRLSSNFCFTTNYF